MLFTITTLVGLLAVLTTPILTGIGLISPQRLSKIIKIRSFANRKQVLKEGLLAFISSIILTGFSTSNVPKSSIEQEKSLSTTFQTTTSNNPSPSVINKPVVSTETTTLSPTPIPTALPTQKPTTTPQPTIKPTTQSVSSQITTTGSWECDCSKTCPNMSCAEAQYQLDNCRCTRRDGDHDGIACDSQCQQY